MSYIYVITNDVNNKQYVGQTSTTLQERFKKHINDKDRRGFEKRPLYNAMNKYGINHFHIKLLEECPSEEVDKKEIYWIGRLDTYKNGYNATLGGEGKPLYNYQEIANKYLELQNQKETALYFNCDANTVKIACEACNVKILSGGEVVKKQIGKKVLLIELNIQFDSIKEAGRYLQNNHYTMNNSLNSVSKNIQKVCIGERKSAYKFHWKFI